MSQQAAEIAARELGVAEDIDDSGRRPGTVTLFLGVALVAAWALVAAFAPVLAPHDPTVSVNAGLLSPSSEHPFGTDRLGFDVLSRVLYAPRMDLYLAVVGTGIALVLGVLIGVPVGYTRSIWGDLVMRLFDGLQAFPLLILALALVASIGQGSDAIIIALAFINVPIFVRVVRGQVLSLRERRFVEAAVATGNPLHRILLRHILPNTYVPILAQATISVAFAIIVIAALSFLGVGIGPPTPEWGAMIQSGTQNIITGQWWVSVFPGLAVASVVLGFHLIGDGLQHRMSTARRR